MTEVSPPLVITAVPEKHHVDGSGRYLWTPESGAECGGAIKAKERTLVRACMIDDGDNIAELEVMPGAGCSPNISAYSAPGSRFWYSSRTFFYLGGTSKKPLVVT